VEITLVTRVTGETTRVVVTVDSVVIVYVAVLVNV
jgi:hypothetical protein